MCLLHMQAAVTPGPFLQEQVQDLSQDQTLLNASVISAVHYNVVNSNEGMQQEPLVLNHIYECYHSISTNMLSVLDMQNRLISDH